MLYHFQWVNPLFLCAIFNSYVSLPEGKSQFLMGKSTINGVNPPFFMVTMDIYGL